MTEEAPSAGRRDVSYDDTVELRIPASGAYLSILRTATAGLAARLDFTLDEIDDLRIAVDEASALLLGDVAPGSNLTCLYTLLPDVLVIRVSAATEGGRLPRQHTFAWTVLTALAGEVETETGSGGTVAIVLRKRRGGAR
ncbi:MAG TPA: anti-sigma regulatory factor [Mycobacteriales bacterium]|nr:anti-sigma regulatory factor [Mycobacteriales bacterium]